MTKKNQTCWTNSVSEAPVLSQLFLFQCLQKAFQCILMLMHLVLVDRTVPFLRLCNLSSSILSDVSCFYHIFTSSGSYVQTSWSAISSLVPSLLESALTAPRCWHSFVQGAQFACTEPVPYRHPKTIWNLCIEFSLRMSVDFLLGETKCFENEEYFWFWLLQDVVD